MRKHSGNAGTPQRDADRDEGILLVGTRSGIATRQRLLRCLAISASLHLSLALSVGPTLGAAGGSRGTRPPAANAVLDGFLLQRVSSKVDGVSNEAPVSPLEPPAKNAAVTAPAQPAPPRPETESRALIPRPEPYYFRASELERRPRVLSDVQPRFPPSAEDAASGKIILRLLINEVGRVDSVVVEHSELPPAFEASAVDAFSKAVFAPGEIGGNAVKSRMRIEVTYAQAG